MKKILLSITLFAIVVSQSMMSCSGGYENIADTTERDTEGDVRSDSVKTPLVITMHADISKEAYGGTRVDDTESESVWKEGDVIYLAFEGEANGYGVYNAATDDWKVEIINDGTLVKNLTSSVTLSYIEGMPLAKKTFNFDNLRAAYRTTGGKYFYNSEDNELTISGEIFPVGGRMKLLNIPENVDSFTVCNMASVNAFNPQQTQDERTEVSDYHSQSSAYISYGFYPTCYAGQKFYRKDIIGNQLCLYGLYVKSSIKSYHNYGIDGKFFYYYSTEGYNSSEEINFLSIRKEDSNSSRYRSDNCIWIKYPIIDNEDKYAEKSGDYLFWRRRPDCFLNSKSGYIDFPTRSNVKWNYYQMTGYAPRGKQNINKEDEKEDENCQWVNLDLPSGTKWAAFDNYGADNEMYNATGDKTLLCGTKIQETSCHWGDRWELPTSDQFRELMEYTIITRYTDKNGVEYLKFTAGGGQYLLLPAAGIGTSIDVGTTGAYMTSDGNILRFDSNTKPYLTDPIPMKASHRYVLKK